MDDFVVDNTKGVASQSAIELGVSLGPDVVERIPGFMEWQKHDVGIIKSHYVATITSDASGTWGCGAFSSRGEWFQLEWPDSWRGLHITIQELLPIVLSVALWGGQWHDSTVRCRCDNAAVVAIVNKGTSRCDKAMQLMHSLFLFTAKYNLILSAQHIPGDDNGAADALFEK